MIVCPIFFNIQLNKTKISTEIAVLSAIYTEQIRHKMLQIKKTNTTKSYVVCIQNTTYRNHCFLLSYNIFFVFAILQKYLLTSKGLPIELSFEFLTIQTEQ